MFLIIILNLAVKYMTKPNAWNQFVKQHKGSGKSMKELAAMYAPVKKTKNEIKRRGTCASEIAEVANLRKQLAVKKRQLSAFLN